jgi:hypothetical protein
MFPQRPRILVQARVVLSKPAIRRDQGADDALALVCAQRNVRFLDFLQSAKSTRSKLARNPICLDPSCLRSKVDATSREVILPLSETLTDRSKTGATHDAYASPLVTLKTTVKCVQNSNSLVAVSITPFAFCASAFRPRKVPVWQRVFHSKLFFQLPNKALLVSRRPHTGGTKSTCRQGATATMFTTGANWIKLLNTAIGLVCYDLQAGNTEFESIGCSKCRARGNSRAVRRDRSSIEVNKYNQPKIGG